MDAERPRSWAEYIGQERMKERLETHIEAAKKGYEPLAHILLCGPPGCGKTSLAALIAQKMEDEFESVIMPLKPDALIRLVQHHRGILFMDEIHRAPKGQQESLLPLLEDGYLQLPGGQRVHTHWLTIVAATTEPENIIPPLYDRFIFKPVYEPYSAPEMDQMVRGMAARIDVDLLEGVVNGLAVASNGLPRNARQLVIAAQALIRTGQDPDITAILHLAGLTHDGLGDQHLEYLRVLDMLGGRAGVIPLATVLRLNVKVVQELERTLLEKDLILFHSTGRQLTQKGYDLLSPPPTKGTS